MQPKSDAQLLRDYAEHGTEAAFTEIVQHHTSLVYSAALRQVEAPDIAAEIAQGVFIGLARGARALAPKLAAEASLAGWLCRSARNLSLNHRRDEFRRQTRERQAMEALISIPEGGPDWERLRVMLDDAMAELNEVDYDALVLRFFQNQDFRSVGAAIGVSDDTAQKRVARALDKLRELLSQRGIRTTAAALSVAISANAVQAAPVGLTVTISAAALAGTAVSTATVVAATTKTIAMTTFQKALVTAAIAAVAGAGLYEAHRAAQLRDQVQTLHQKQTPLQEQIHQLQRERDEAVGKLAALTDDNERLTRNSAELLRLRGEVGVLRKRADELRNENFHLQNHFQSNSVAALNPVKPPVVAKVIIKRIKQPQTVEEELIRREISVKPGNLFERASVDADVRKLYDTGWFSNIRVVEGNSTEGVTLNYLLQEKPKLTQIRFSGNTRFDEQVLAGFTSCKAGQLMDERTFSEDAQRIQELYVKLGFPNAKVKTVSNVNEDVGEGDVTFEIVE